LDSRKFYDQNLEVIDLDYPIEAFFIIDLNVSNVEVGENMQEHLFAHLEALAQDRKAEIF